MWRLLLMRKKLLIRKNDAPAIFVFCSWMKKMAKYFVCIKNVCTFASLLRVIRAFSSAGSEHLPYKQRVGGSNPSTPTSYKLL